MLTLVSRHKREEALASTCVSTVFAIASLNTQGSLERGPSARKRNGRHRLLAPLTRTPEWW
jgi:hypothetical protein